MAKHILEHYEHVDRQSKANIDGVEGEYYAVDILLYDDETNEIEERTTYRFKPFRYR